MFQILFPYRASYFAVIILVACTLPLYLASLPNIKTLLIISLFFGVLICLKKNIFFTYTFIFSMVVLSFVYQAQRHQEDRLDFQYAKSKFLLTAQIIDFPKNSTSNEQDNTSLSVRLTSNVVASDQSIVLRKNTLLKISCYRCKKIFLLGEVWQFQVKLKPPLGSASWGAFDYEKYAFANRIVATGYLQEQSARKLASPQSLINQFRQGIHSMLDDKFSNENFINKRVVDTNYKNLNADNLALLKALIIGDKTQLSSEHWRLFRNTGTNHLMSISGLHITLIFFLVSLLIRTTISLLLSALPLVASRGLMECCFYRVSLPTFSMFCALVVAILYAFTTGMLVPTQRAILMLTIICIARLCSKNISLLEALSAAVIVILLFYPLSTLHGGFWLSVIAVFMIGVLIKSRDTKWLIHCRMALAMIPVTLLFFNNAPLISPLANALLIPIVSVIVLPFSLLLVLISFSIKPLEGGIASEFMGQAWQLLNMSIDMVWYLLELLSRWQLGVNEYVPLSMSSNSTAISFSVLVISLILVWRLAFSRSLLILPFLVFLLIEPKEKLHNGEFSMTTLDVGQGLAIVLETASSYIIFDTGIGFSGSDSAERIILPFLKHQGRKKLSHIIVSHADNDHIGGLQTLGTYYPLTPVLINEVKNLKGYDIKSNISSCYAKKWQQDGVTFEIFPKIKLSKPHLKKRTKSLKRNNRSCVMKVTSTYGSVLLPADIERVAEHYLIKNFPQKMKSQVLVAAHHGSRTSSTPVFLNNVSPELVIIPSAYFSSYGHPHKDVLTRLQQQSEKVMMTGRSGSIKINFLKDGIQKREFRALHPRFWYSELTN